MSATIIRPNGINVINSVHLKFVGNGSPNIIVKTKGIAMNGKKTERVYHISNVNDFTLLFHRKNQKSLFRYDFTSPLNIMNFNNFIFVELVRVVRGQVAANDLCL